MTRGKGGVKRTAVHRLVHAVPQGCGPRSTTLSQRPVDDEMWRTVHRFANSTSSGA